MLWAGALKVIGFAKVAGGVLAQIPWHVWFIGALAAAIPITANVKYREGHSEGRESVLTELRQREAETRLKASEAARKADTKGAERALTENQSRARDISAIERAEANDQNTLDSLF